MMSSKRHFASWMNWITSSNVTNVNHAIMLIVHWSCDMEISADIHMSNQILHEMIMKTLSWEWHQVSKVCFFIFVCACVERPICYFHSDKNPEIRLSGSRKKIFKCSSVWGIFRSMLMWQKMSDFYHNLSSSMLIIKCRPGS